MVSQNIASEIVEILSNEKLEIARELAVVGKFIPRINRDIEEHQSNFDAYVSREVFCLIDYVSLYFSTNMLEYKYLYIGERLKMAYDAASTAQQRNERLLDFMHRDKLVFEDGLNSCRSEVISSVKGFFDEIIDQFHSEISAELRVLFIGDCLHQDIIGTLSVLMMQHGIAVRPHVIASKNIVEVHKNIASLEQENFDAVFYSPLTYEYDIEFSTLLYHANCFASSRNIESSVENIFETIKQISNRLTTTFECPIFIHNTACIIRDTSKFKLFVKLQLLARVRKTITRSINDKLQKFVVNKNSKGPKQFNIINELELLKNNTAFELGKSLYFSFLQHPTKFGMMLADTYNQIIFSLGKLNGRKLIVCDLDNTLWEGVIGEGPVDHYIDRQNILLSLKRKGLILAINSKNDPNNIHWDGGILSDDDFVFKSIDWAPKVNAFAEMSASLNIKMKDFIFIDDRLDELELVSSIYPEILCLDATKEESWQYFGKWNDLLSEESDMDRTKMYKEREHRQSYIEQNDIVNMDEASAFKKLNLHLSIREAVSDDTERVVELINRTNQFNMKASRTTFATVEKWIADENVKVLVAKMSDKFGNMGVISVLVANTKEDLSEISVFVLSCRVFGYQVERAILNQVKRHAQQAGLKAVVGEYVETASNAPCKLVYKNNEFTDNKGSWQYEISTNLTVKDPEWLTIEVT